MTMQKTPIAHFLKEDIGKGDITCDMLFKDQHAEAYIFTKQPCVLAGLVEAIDLFTLKRVSVHPMAEDGQILPKDSTILEMSGRAKDLLCVERTALNVLSRMSGIATQTRWLVEKVHRKNQKCLVAATRKTTPGFRFYEKKAVVIGGGNPHRFGLFDAVLIKDNHIAMSGGLENVLKKVKKRKIPVEIEVEDIAGALRCAEVGIEVIMLDNFKPGDAKEAYEAIKKINPTCVVEISGGITPENIEDYAAFADMISLGYLTHTVRPIDFSMEYRGG